MPWFLGMLPKTLLPWKLTVCEIAWGDLTKKNPTMKHCNIQIEAAVIIPPALQECSQSLVSGIAKHPHPRNLAWRTVVIISSLACSNILTTSIKLGRKSELASQQRDMISARAGGQSAGIGGRTPRFTTANAAWTAVMFWKGNKPVMSSHSTMPKLYTSTLWL
jgi:hypothetical protein